MRETVNFCSLNLTKPKKKSKNTTKCYNIFTISLFSAEVSFSLIFYYLFYRNTIFIKNSRCQIVTDFKMDPWLVSLFYPSIVTYLWFVVKLMWKCCELSIFFIWSIRNRDLNNCKNIVIITSVTTFSQNI